ncbi:TatD family hydrolase [Halomonas sp. V046]|uniref:TatD family hydrolase n=1 Tax=Halomonas sp. V046 TaxID=3459611 RepID=UPI004044829E
MSPLIDAHCHLDLAAFDADRDEAIRRAQDVGVGHFVVPGTTRARWGGVLALGRRADVSVCLGLHPYFMAEHRLDRPAGHGRANDDDLAALEVALDQHPEVVALGECGIDARFKDSWADQWRLFDAQLRLAKARDLPVVIHCVQANDEVAKRLRQLALPRGGLIHAFAGSPQQASRFLELGYLLGLGGAVTFERAARLRRTVASLPDDGFVLETDSPDMPLSGHQGSRNEPARVAEVCREIARLRDVCEDTVAKASSATARRLFRLSPGE